MDMPNNARPVNIRRHIENYGDPYISSEGPGEIKICSECRAVYSGQRWYLKEQMPAEDLKHHKIGYTVCPACQKIHDNMPGGIVMLTGQFLKMHETELLNLIKNEGDRAMAVNPLERIMDIQKNGASLTIYTTNERLAQRLGKAIHKAYDGDVAYKWSEDTKLARVLWQRD
jgi:NMD protein affecting ribosome stability and mRNA decay